MIHAQQILQQYWGYSTFRGEQLNIIAAVLEKKDTLALLPTGGGKSICFQIPALMQEGVCLVVSPLIALMKDQVENLEKRNIPAAALYSGMSFYDVQQTLHHAVQGHYKFLYVSPERLQTKLLNEYLPALNINLIAVDEAHCISQWGYDFRPPYLRIAAIRKFMPDVSVIALTASATPVVQKDIIEKLEFTNAAVFHQSFTRENLSYSVFYVDSKINKTTEILKKVAGSSVVYCRNRKETKRVAQLLQLQNISADFYHAGLTQQERSEKQQNWIQNKTRVIVCTNAFGMGIDKPDVRTVIHFDLPDCLENYYQEAGRAGRDGKKAYAVALLEGHDEQELLHLPNIKYPSVEDIKKVYQAIADYLQIPVGLGQFGYYNFDLITFCNNFKLDVHLVLSTLKVLEQEGHLTFNENIFLPSQVVFTADKDLLNHIEETHPELEKVMKCLLRTYEGIFDNRVSVNEKLIAKLCNLSYDAVYKQLEQLAGFSIIEYLPQKETPQIYFLLNRASAQHLHINNEAYLLRKKQYADRLQYLINYLNNKINCRANTITSYFGETVSTNCGVCDNCINNKSKDLTAEEFSTIEQAVLAALSKPLPIKELITKLSYVTKDKSWKVIQFLQAEKKILISEEGIVSKC